MARIDETGAYGVETNNEDGHKIHYHFSIYGFIYTESLYFTRDHETMCWELPNIWKIGVRLQRACSSKNISCHLSVKRIDTSSRKVRVSSTVRLYNVQLQQLDRVLSFPMMEVRSQQEVQRTSDPVLTPIEMSSLLGQELKVRVSLNVTHCHRIGQRYDPVTSLNARMEKIFFPK
ncbi:hypothetical protein AVEN_16302-1 [Araneus ventricosus]|uniref:Uncharacterized protein n=1 Tax=Araneus ventricosus TaxID=182803 RepID=A0A4Y2ABZ8_ARAVE|nr:hypothetical protein AVEN_16302-1 [Araneus ventricosus]